MNYSVPFLENINCENKQQETSQLIAKLFTLLRNYFLKLKFINEIAYHDQVDYYRLKYNHMVILNKGDEDFWENNVNPPRSEIDYICGLSQNPAKTCQAIVQSGKNKGSICGKAIRWSMFDFTLQKTYEDVFCAKHKTPENIKKFTDNAQIEEAKKREQVKHLLEKDHSERKNKLELEYAYDVKMKERDLATKIENLKPDEEQISQLIELIRKSDSALCQILLYSFKIEFEENLQKQVQKLSESSQTKLKEIQMDIDRENEFCQKYDLSTRFTLRAQNFRTDLQKRVKESKEQREIWEKEKKQEMIEFGLIK